MARRSDSCSCLAVLMLLAAFMTKLVSEAIHELLGHGTFVLLFGGQVTGFRISMLWPYELSHISWSVPVLDIWHRALIYGGGILATSLTLFLTQAILYKTKPRWEVGVILNWLSFWCLMNAGGYLVVGGVYPFGDVKELIALNVFSSQISLIVGVILIAVGFFLISLSLNSAVRPILGYRAPVASIIVWSVMPAVVWLAMAGLGIFSYGILLTSFIPPALSGAIAAFSMNRTELRNNPE